MEYKTYIKTEYIVISFIVLPNLIWGMLDKSVWMWDQSWYAEVTVDLWWTMLNEPMQWFSALISAFGSKAPGIAWIGQFFVPLGTILRNIEFGLLLSICVTQALLLYLIFKLLTNVFEIKSSSALICLLFIGSMPLFIGLSHHYMVETLQLLAVTYIFYVACESKSWSRMTTLGHLMLSASVAMLAKATSPIYCLIPGIIGCYNLVVSNKNLNKEKPIKKIIFLLIGITVFLLTAAWYLKNYKALLHFISIASSGEIAMHYGHAGTFINKLRFWINRVETNLLYSYLWIAAAIVVIAFAIKSILKYLSLKTYRYRFKYRDLIAFTAVLHIIVVLAVLSLGVNEETRYLLPTALLFGIILSWMLEKLKNNIINALVLVAAMFVFISVQLQTFGIINRDPNISKWLGVLAHENIMRESVKKVVKASCIKESEGKINMCGIQYWWLNANTLSFFGSKQRLETGVKCYYTSLGYAQNEAQAALKRIETFKSPFFISVDEPNQIKPPDFLNIVSLPVLNEIKNAHHYKLIENDKLSGIIIFKRFDK